MASSDSERELHLESLVEFALALLSHYNSLKEEIVFFGSFVHYIIDCAAR